VIPGSNPGAPANQSRAFRLWRSLSEFRRECPRENATGRISFTLPLPNLLSFGRQVRERLSRLTEAEPDPCSVPGITGALVRPIRMGRWT
jgi:hypothetical protein